MLFKRYLCQQQVVLSSSRHWENLHLKLGLMPYLRQAELAVGKNWIVDCITTSTGCSSQVFVEC